MIVPAVLGILIGSVPFLMHADLAAVMMMVGVDRH